MLNDYVDTGNSKHRVNPINILLEIKIEYSQFCIAVSVNRNELITCTCISDLAGKLNVC